MDHSNLVQTLMRLGVEPYRDMQLILIEFVNALVSHKANVDAAASD